MEEQRATGKLNVTSIWQSTFEVELYAQLTSFTLNENDSILYFIRVYILKKGTM